MPAAFSTSAFAVYPRVYGESMPMRRGIRRSAGLSPRVRGIHRRHGRLGRGTGSIPACTGNPLDLVTAIGLPWVYPRVYGESTS